jgi:2-oxo-4-hydroxy-4-carboxy-5-ureidoimidazoline decarboxylase
MTIAEFDHLGIDLKKKLLHQCCGSNAWVEKVLEALPAEDLVDLLEIAEEKWYECDETDWLEAFSQHPKIGDLHTLKTKYGSTVEFTENEQSSVKHASEETLQELAEANRLYEEKFGYIFIVCATGKSANEMLGLLKERLKNNAKEEINIAMEEQNKITRLRLEKSFTA